MMIAFLLAAKALPSTPDLGKALGRCRPNEDGPAYQVDVLGLKDRQGRLKLELYPANERDFLADDNLLIGEGKPFRRVEESIPPSGPVRLCIRAPGPGTYALSLLHDRDGNRRFGLTVDGIGFAGNPQLHFSKPRASSACATVGPHPVHISITLNYRRGLFSIGPLRGGDARR